MVQAVFKSSDSLMTWWSFAKYALRVPTVLELGGVVPIHSFIAVTVSWHDCHVLAEDRVPAQLPYWSRPAESGSAMLEAAYWHTGLVAAVSDRHPAWVLAKMSVPGTWTHVCDSLETWLSVSGLPPFVSSLPSFFSTFSSLALSSFAIEDIESYLGVPAC